MRVTDDSYDIFLTPRGWNLVSSIPLESPLGGKSPGYTQCNADQCLWPGSGSTIFSSPLPVRVIVSVRSIDRGQGAGRGEGSCRAQCAVRQSVIGISKKNTTVTVTLKI
jgi:hypothetical protein